jgi:thiamine kinase-like enzyme
VSIAINSAGETAAQDSAEARVARLPIWRGRPRISPLLGGLSNLSFVVDDGARRYVVRLGGDVPVHNVERTREVRIARAAHAAGFSPELVYTGPGVMVTRYLECRTYTAADVRTDTTRVLELVGRFHREMGDRLAEIPRHFAIFDALRGYARELAGSASPLLARLPEAMAAAVELEAAVVPANFTPGSGPGQPLGGAVFAHNDLLPANLLDDGRRLWLIDFEYAGPGDALFDLGNLATNSDMSEAETAALLETYFGGGVSSALRRNYAALGCASLLREVLWALVSELHLSAPGADYIGYARRSLARFDAALAEYRAAFG